MLESINLHREKIFGYKEEFHLYIIGDFKSFKKSVLGKISEKRFIVHDFIQEFTNNIHALHSNSAFIKWDPYMRIKIPAFVYDIVPTGAIINDTKFSSDKKTVEEIFKHIFGYDLGINDVNYLYPVVKKSVKNAKHDGIITTFQESEVDRKNYTYTKLINNECKDFVLDLRVPYIKGEIPFVYMKYRNSTKRFSNTNNYAELESLFNVFTREEYQKILEFCNSIEIEYGELDILRNYDDGKIYIIDVNNTPFGPPNHIKSEDYEKSLMFLENTIIKKFFIHKTY
jgi:hypothetical protein